MLFSAVFRDSGSSTIAYGSHVLGILLTRNRVVCSVVCGVWGVVCGVVVYGGV